MTLICEYCNEEIHSCDECWHKFEPGQDIIHTKFGHFCSLVCLSRYLIKREIKYVETNAVEYKEE